MNGESGEVVSGHIVRKDADGVPLLSSGSRVQRSGSSSTGWAQPDNIHEPYLAGEAKVIPTGEIPPEKYNWKVVDQGCCWVGGHIAAIASILATLKKARRTTTLTWRCINRRINGPEAGKGIYREYQISRCDK